MSKWRLLKSESFVLPRSKAVEFAAKHAGLQHSPVEREQDKARVKRLTHILRNGEALPFNWAVVEYAGQEVRMNGQHSSVAILEVGAELPEKLAFHLDRYQADDRDAMVSLFRQFDQRWSSRTQSDIAGAYQGLVPSITSCNRKVLKCAAEAISWCLRAVDGIQTSHGDDTYELFHREVYTPFFLWVNGITNGRKELLKKEVVAAMWKTHEVSQSAATRFWRDVSFGPDFFTDDTMPGAVLIGQLAKAGEDKEYREKEFPNVATYYKKSIKAWNAFCVGQRITSLNVTKAKGWPDVTAATEPESAAA